MTHVCTHYLPNNSLRRVRKVWSHTPGTRWQPSASPFPSKVVVRVGRAFLSHITDCLPYPGAMKPGLPDPLRLPSKPGGPSGRVTAPLPPRSPLGPQVDLQAPSVGSRLLLPGSSSSYSLHCFLAPWQSPEPPISANAPTLLPPTFLGCPSPPHPPAVLRV